MNNQIEKIGYIELITAMILSGMIGMFVEFSHQPVINIVFYRCLIGAVILFIYMLIKNTLRKHRSLNKADIALIILIGLSVVLNWLSLFAAYAYTSIGIATTIYHVQPIIVFFVGAFIFKEKITSNRVLWLIIAFFGVLLIINPGNDSMMHSHYLKGCMLALIAASLYSVATLASKVLKNVSPYLITLTQLLIGTGILWPFVQYSVLPHSTLEFTSILTLGVVNSVFMYILLYSSYQKLSTSSIAILSYIYPLVAVAIDYIVFNKSLSLFQITGGLMVLIAGLFNKLNINPLSLIKKYQTRSI